MDQAGPLAPEEDWTRKAAFMKSVGARRADWDNGSPPKLLTLELLPPEPEPPEGGPQPSAAAVDPKKRDAELRFAAGARLVKRAE